MLHHVSIEVHPEHAERALDFLRLIGSERVDAPEPIAPLVSMLAAVRP